MLHDCEIRYREAHPSAVPARAAFAKVRDSLSNGWAAARAYLATQGHRVEQQPNWMLDDREEIVW
jgi:hypothetical protein